MAAGMTETAIPGWNSWRAEFPAQIAFLPGGLTVTPAAYAASRSAFTDFPAAASDIRFGPRDIAGRRIGLTLAHAGTEIDWAWERIDLAPDSHAVRASWRSLKQGEWGLRFWLNLVFEIDPDLADGMAGDPAWRFDPKSGILSGKLGKRHVAVIGHALPLLATFHESRAALAEEYARYGYFYLESRGLAGKVPVLRYNLDEMADFTIAVAVAPDAAAAEAGARAALAATSSAPLAALDDSGALDALRDIVGWNSVYDPINRRPYMSLSRFWVAQKFGGFGIWLDDIFYHALMAGLFAAEAARQNIRAILATETPEGNLACLVTGRDRWIDRSQPPIGAFILWKIVAHTGAEDLVDLAFPRLLQNHDWWFSHRDGARSGLLSWGTSPVGDGLYRGTKLAAKDESAMDNSPLHDETMLDPESSCLDSWDIGLNALIVLDGEILADWAAARGDRALAERLRDRIAGLRARIRETLWDEDRAIFANRLWQGKFIDALAPTSFYPLLARIADPAQIAAALRHLRDPRKFGGAFRLPSVARDHPAYADNVYWRGRIWPPLNYLVYQGLKRVAAEDAAGDLAADSWRLFRQSWAKRQCPENFSAETGAADDQPDTDLFYGWGGLMPLIAVNERIDVSPWHGWEIVHDGREGRIGPLLAFGGAATEICIAGGRLRLSLDGEPVLESDIRGRHRHLRFDRRQGIYALEVPATGGRIAFPGLGGAAILRALYDGREIAPARAAGNLVFDLPPAAQPARLELRIEVRR